MRAPSRFAAAVLAALSLALTLPATAGAHALVGRRDLPIPEWLFGWGASLVLIASFAALALGWREARFAGRPWRPAPAWLSRIVLSPVTRAIAGVVGVFLLGVVVWSGAAGIDDPASNFSVTFVFVTFWLGLVVLSVMFGNVFRAFDPWAAIARAAGGAHRVVLGQERPPPLPYPDGLGLWPAVAGLLGFLWLELVWPLGEAGIAPRDVAIAAIVYTAVTLFAMLVYGSERWLERGETFSVYFGMFARLSPVEIRDGRLGIRPPLVGATDWPRLPGAAALVLVAIAGTSYDGAQEGFLLEPIADLAEWLADRGLGESLAPRLADTVFLALSVAAIAGLYWVGVRGMRTVKGSPALGRLGADFAHTLIPIALAYLVAHYFTLVLFQEQAQFGFLLSDPLGEGWDLFGTASTRIDFGIIGASTVWYIQVAALVVGHVCALVLAHDRALALYGEHRSATRSQYWMLLVMIGFTSLGLYLLAEANA